MQNNPTQSYFNPVVLCMVRSPLEQLGVVHETTGRPVRADLDGLCP